MLVLIKANFGASPQLLSRHEELALLTPPPPKKRGKRRDVIVTAGRVIQKFGSTDK